MIYYLANALENIDSLLKVPNVEYWELELYVAKVTWTDFKGFIASFANFSFFAHALTILSDRDVLQV